MGRTTPKKRPTTVLDALMDAHEAAKPRDTRRDKPTGPHVSEATRKPRIDGAFGNEPDIDVAIDSRGRTVIDKRHPDRIAERKWASLRKKVSHGPAVRV